MADWFLNVNQRGRFRASARLSTSGVVLALAIALVPLARPAAAQLTCDATAAFNRFVPNVAGIMEQAGYTWETTQVTLPGVGTTLYPGGFSGDFSSGTGTTGSRDSRFFLNFGNSVGSQLLRVFKGANLLFDLRLDSNDVVVVRGCTPPPVGYFSLTPYYSSEVRDYLAPGVANEDTLRHQSTPLTPTLNSSNIQTDNGEIFDAPFTAVITASRVAAADFLAAIHQVGQLAGLQDPALPAIYFNIADKANLLAIPSPYLQGFDGGDPRIGARLVIDNRGVSPVSPSDPLQPWRTASVVFDSPLQSGKTGVLIFKKAGLADPADGFPVPAPSAEEALGPVENSAANRDRFASAIDKVKAFYSGKNMGLVGRYDMRSDWISSAAVGHRPNASFPTEPVPIHYIRSAAYCFANDVACEYANPDSHFSVPEYGPAPMLENHIAGPDDLFVVVGIDHNAYEQSTSHRLGMYHVHDRTGSDPLKLYNLVPPRSVLDDLDYMPFDNQPVFGTEAGDWEDLFLVQIGRAAHPALQANMAKLTPADDMLAIPWVVLGEARLNLQTGTAPRQQDLIPWTVLHFQLQADGAACTTGSECNSAFCSDGLCCNSDCGGLNEACNIPGSEGMCVGILLPGDPCTDTTECASGECSDTVCCDSACDGNTEACNIVGSEGTCTAMSPNGTPCTDTSQCTSGERSDALCCDSACSDARQACNVVGSEGNCSPTLPDGSRCSDDTECDSSPCEQTPDGGFCGGPAVGPPVKAPAASPFALVAILLGLGALAYRRIR